MSDIKQVGIVGLGEALASVIGGAAVEVDAIDQPWPVAGLGADQRRHRDPFGARGGDLQERGAASTASGAALGRPQAMTCLVLEAEPGAQVRRPARRRGTSRLCGDGPSSARKESSARSRQLKPGGPGVLPDRVRAGSLSSGRSQGPGVKGPAAALHGRRPDNGAAAERTWPSCPTAPTFHRIARRGAPSGRWTGSPRLTTPRRRRSRHPRRAHRDSRCASSSLWVSSQQPAPGRGKVDVTGNSCHSAFSTAGMLT